MNRLRPIGISNHPGTSIQSNPVISLELADTDAGFLPNRLTTTQRDAIVDPPTGLLIWNTSTVQYEGYNGSAWVAIGGGGTLTGYTSTTTTAIGTGAGGVDPRTTLSTYIGAGAGSSNTSGVFNVAIGESALLDNISGNGNTAIGVGALHDNISGNTNTTIGSGAGNNITTSNANVCIGAGAGDNITIGSSNITIGHDTTVTDATADNQLNIGNEITGILGGHIDFAHYITVGETLSISIQTAGAIEVLSGNVELSAGNVTLVSGQDLRFNGIGDGNWRIGLGLAAFSESIVDNPLAIVLGTGGDDGFAIGSAGGNSFFEIDSSSGNGWFRNNVTVGETLFVNGVAVSASIVEQIQVSVSSAELLAINVTPKIIVPAPGAGKVILVQTVLYDYVKITANYTAGANLGLYYNNASGAVADSGTSISSPGVTASALSAAIGGVSAGADPTMVDNQAVSLSAASALLGGSGTLKITVNYITITR